MPAQTVIAQVEVAVPVDIKPQSCPNPLNCKTQGLLPVAILGTADFDVTTLDVFSIQLAGVAPLRSALEDVATPTSGGRRMPGARAYWQFV